MARLGPISQESLQERTYQALRSAILDGEYLPGERLFEAAIAEALQVSRNPVREALRRLQQDGLVRTQAHRGIYVTEVPEDEIEDVYRIRASLEGTAASLAAERMTVEEIARLAEILHEQEEAARLGDRGTKAPVSASQADSFHRLIHEGARSPMLLTLLEQIYAQVSHFRKLTLRYPGRAAVSAAGHAQVYEAIRAHDAGAAERLMRGHVDGARLALTRELAEVKEAEAREQAAAQSGAGSQAGAGSQPAAATHLTADERPRTRARRRATAASLASGDGAEGIEGEAGQAEGRKRVRRLVSSAAGGGDGVEQVERTHAEEMSR